MSKKDAMKKKRLPVSLTEPIKVVVARRPPTIISKEFKLAALERMRTGALNPTALALELGIRRNQLYKWAKLFEAGDGHDSFNGPGRLPVARESELSRLRRKLAKAEEELAILKKFDAYLTRRKL